MEVKISEIQQALKTLGFLHITHAADGEWDRSTAGGYMMACTAANMSEAQSVQPIYMAQLPESIRDLILGNTPVDADADAKAAAETKAAADAQAQADADAKDAAEAKAAADAQAQADADAKAKADADAKAAADAQAQADAQTAAEASKAEAPKEEPKTEAAKPSFNVQSGKVAK